MKEYTPYLKNISCILLMFCLFFCIHAARAHAQYNIGYKSISTWNQKENLRLDISIWYPTNRAPSEFNLDDYIIFGSKNAPILQLINEDLAAPVRILREEISDKAERDGLTAWERLQELKKAPLPFYPLPLILFSHDSGATRFSNHTIAQALAAQGYIVAIPMHSGDNAMQMSLSHSALAFTKRAYQLSASLDLLLTDESLDLYIDKDNISLLAFGSAGTAGLLLAGARLNPHAWDMYCDKYSSMYETEEHIITTLSPLERLLLPKEQIQTTGETRINPYCVSPLKEIVNELVEDLILYSEYESMTNEFYDNINVARKNIAKENGEYLKEYSNLLRRQNPAFKNFIDTPPFIQPYFPSYKKTVSYIDPRFKRMVFISPGYSMLFDKSSLADIEIPLLFIGLQDDKVNLPEYQSEIFVQAINNISIDTNPQNISLVQETEEEATHAMGDLDTDDLDRMELDIYNKKPQENTVIKNNAQHFIIYETDIWGLQAPCSGNHNDLVEICKTVSDDTRIEVTKIVSDSIADFVPFTTKP